MIAITSKMFMILQKKQMLLLKSGILMKVGLLEIKVEKPNKSNL